MTTPYERIRLAWDSEDRPAELNRVVERMAAEGITRDVLDDALGLILQEIRDAGADDDTEEIINCLGDRLHGWCHASRHIGTQGVELATVAEDGASPVGARTAVADLGVSMREMVRTALQELGGNAKPGAIQEFIKAKYDKGISKIIISNYKSSMKQRDFKLRDRPPASGSVNLITRAGGKGIKLEDLAAISGLIVRLGTPHLQQLVEQLLTQVEQVDALGKKLNAHGIGWQAEVDEGGRLKVILSQSTSSLDLPFGAVAKNVDPTATVTGAFEGSPTEVLGSPSPSQHL